MEYVNVIRLAAKPLIVSVERLPVTPWSNFWFLLYGVYNIDRKNKIPSAPPQKLNYSGGFSSHLCFVVFAASYIYFSFTFHFPFFIHLSFFFFNICSLFSSQFFFFGGGVWYRPIHKGGGGGIFISAHPSTTFYQFAYSSLDSVLVFTLVFCILGAESRHSDEALLPDVGYTPPRANRKIK